MEGKGRKSEPCDKKRTKGIGKRTKEEEERKEKEKSKIMNKWKETKERRTM